MKLTTMKATLSLMALVATLAGCGGGTDAEAGAPAALNVQPSTLTLTAVAESAGGPPKGQCGGGYAGQIFIYGGAGPYRLDNTAPNLISLDKSNVSGPGGSFNVTYLGGCFEPVLIVIVDKLNNQVILTLNNKPSDT